MMNLRTTIGLILVSVALAAMASAARADDADVRLNQLVQTHIDAPWPATNTAWGMATYALSCLYMDQDVSTANGFINTLHDDYNVPDNAERDSEIYFKLNLLWRIYSDATMNARLTATARDDLEDMMWRWIHYRSRISDATNSVWRISGSENHDAMQKTGYLLCAQALKDAGAPYGPDRMLADGHTIQEHFEAWTEYWKAYIPARAREGINCEVASPTYAKYTLGCYYNIRDYAESHGLRELAERLITLYWADTACDFLPTGIRGGAEVRCYKDENLYRGSTSYAFRPLLWAYGWHETWAGGGHPYILPAATSTYRVPAIIRSCAMDGHRPNYLYTSRRFGQGGEADAER